MSTEILKAAAEEAALAEQTRQREIVEDARARASWDETIAQINTGKSFEDSSDDLTTEESEIQASWSKTIKDLNASINGVSA